MFDHVTIRVSNRDESRRFYERALGELGFERTSSGEHYDEWWDFSIAQASDAKPVTGGLHVAFTTDSQQRVDAWWRALVDAGYRNDGPPGPRPQYHESYYGAFVLDPDGNSAEAVVHDMKRGGDNHIDHMWVRVADIAASRAFYETIAPFAGFELAHVRPERVHFSGSNRSFGLVHDERPTTENLHWAFPASDNEIVDEFHRIATSAGYRDNGAPGERRVYHAGYYGAYVLDPDGNNVEAVWHNRS